MPDAPHILIVEDGATEALVLRRLLERHGYRVSVTASGREALALLEREPARLVVSDIDMPEMNGYAMCAALKRNPRLCTVPVILLTSLAKTEHILEGLRAGADFYLTKPYAPGHLIERVSTLLARAGSPPDPDAEPLPVSIAGREHSVTAGRRQMLNLLLSTYESAVQQNRALLDAQHELNQRNELLREQSRKLEEQQEKLQEANIQLAALAVTDGLTGLKNHRAFKERLAEEFHRAARYQLSFALLLLDVDHFKAFNDSFGHPAGDEVLRRVGVLLRENIRDTDFAARYGGEEFVVLLPFTGAAEAFAMAERIRLAVAGTAWDRRAVSLSIGIACAGEKTKTFADLIAAADAALYKSKESGRNRVTAA